MNSGRSLDATNRQNSKFIAIQDSSMMNLESPNTTTFVPDGVPVADALKRITHLGIGAHQDDLEFMAFHGIVECFAKETLWFGGVTCTDGAGSSRTGVYENFSDIQMTDVRHQEQNHAATIGRYGVMIQLGNRSSVIKSADNPALKNDLKEILLATRPTVVYTHNPADKHDTHIGVVVAALHAMRELPRELRPQKVIGCEVWRDLDWLPDAEKVLMDVSGHDALAASLNGVFESQIAGGKRYDLATHGRRAANATFLDSHATDQATQMIFGMDLTPLVADESTNIAEYVCAQIDRFKSDVATKLNHRLGSH